MLVLSLSRVTAEGVRMPLLRFVGTRRGLLMGPPPNSLNHSADSTGRASSSTQLENSHAEDSNLIVTSSMPDSDDIEEPGNVHCQLICHSEGQAQARVEKNTQVPVGTRLCPCTPYQTPELQNATCTPRSTVSTFPRPTTRSTTPTRAHPPIPLLPPSPISHVVVVLA